MKSLAEILTEYQKIIRGPVIAIETGCSWSWKEEELPWISTLNIVNTLIRPTGGKLYSLDNDADKIETCRSELGIRGLDEYVEFIHGDSVRSIAEIQDSINFVWHDSAEDSDHAWAEFMAVQKLLVRYDPHVICVDDFGSATSKKWQAISKELYANGYKISTFNTPTGLIIGNT